MALSYRYWSIAIATLVPTKTLSGGPPASILSHAWRARLHGNLKLQQKHHDISQVHQQVLFNMRFYVAFDVKLQSVDIGVQEFFLAGVG